MQHVENASSPPSGKIAIGIFGLSDHEVRLVRCVLGLTTASGRIHSYTLLDGPGTKIPDIAILDADSASAKECLQNLRGANPQCRMATLSLVHDAPTDKSGHFLVRPLAPTRMLAQLDHIADEITNVSPPPVITPAPPPMVAPRQAAIAAVPRRDTVLAGQDSLLDDAPVNTKSTHRALIIDDSLTARINIDIELRQMKIHADWAQTGEQGLQMLEDKSYDIVFLDIVLPNADGYEICKLIRRNQANKRVPVVMLTSKSSPFDRIRGTLSGCDSYLTKPIDLVKFRAVIGKYLKKSDVGEAKSVTRRQTSLASPFPAPTTT